MVLKEASIHWKRKRVAQACFAMEQALHARNSTGLCFPILYSEENFYQNYGKYIYTKEGSQTSEDLLEHCSISAVTIGHR